MSSGGALAADIPAVGGAVVTMVVGTSCTARGSVSLLLWLVGAGSTGVVELVVVDLAPRWVVDQALPSGASSVWERVAELLVAMEL